MKRFVGILFGAILGFAALVPQASAGLFFYPGERNQVLYNNYENLYDSLGNFKSPLSTPVVGDHLAGIFQVNRINDLTSGSNATNIPDVITFTGVFDQQITSVVVVPGPLPTFAITLGNPAVFTFNGPGGASDTFTLTDLLATGDMFAMYADPVAGGTPFTFQGALSGNVANAQDGSLLLTAALDTINDPDNVATATVSFFPPPFPPVTGLSTETLSILTNNTGLVFAQISPMTFAGNPGATGQLVLRSAFSTNSDGLSHWAFTSFDPAEVQPNVIPELSSLWMLGMGLSGFGIFRRRKLLG